LPAWAVCKQLCTFAVGEIISTALQQAPSFLQLAPASAAPPLLELAPLPELEPLLLLPSPPSSPTASCP
jgi:hypothetical protein